VTFKEEIHCPNTDHWGDDEWYIVGWVFIPKPAIEAQLALHSFASADAGHLKKPAGPGAVYTVVGVDANFQLFPLCHSIQLGYENKESWERFFSFLHESIPGLNVIISDNNKVTF
jgi:hypothetical protein